MSTTWLNSVLVLGVYSAAACSPGDSARSSPMAADSLAAARAMCESLAKDKLTSPSVATFSSTTVKRDPATNAFVGRGEVTAPNPLNVEITHRFICVVDVDKTGRGNVIFRDSNRKLYEEMVARMGL